MGLSFILSGFPLFVLIITGLMNGFAVSGGAPVCISQSGGACSGNAGLPPASFTTFSCTSGFNPCFSSAQGPPALPTNAKISCTTTDINPNLISSDPPSCLILQGMCFGIAAPNNNPNLFCRYIDIFRDASTFLKTGTTITTGSVTPSGGVAVNNVQNTGFLVTSDWTIIAVGILALAIVGSVAVFGSTVFNTETAHLVFMVTAMLAAWGILTIASGLGNGSSFWGQLDAASGMSLGTVGYTIISLVYFMSILKAISRGGT